MSSKRGWALAVVCFIFGGCLVRKQQNPVVREVEVDQDTLNTPIPDAILSLFRQSDLSLEGLVVEEIGVDGLGFTHIRCSKTFQGLPVFKEEVIYHFNKEGELYFTSGEKLVETGVNTNPRVNKDQAGQMAVEEMKKIKMDGGSVPANLKIELGFLREKLADISTSLVLVWKVTPPENDYPQVFVDAQNGVVVYSDSGIRYDENR